MRVCCALHIRPYFYFVFLTSTGNNRGFKVEASPRPQPVIFRSFLFGYDLSKWGTNGEPSGHYTPIGGGGVKSLNGVFYKTTPPNTRVQCQNFRNFGKRENGRTSAYNAVFALQIQS